MLHLLCPSSDHVTTDLSLQTETALMYDAALLFATALGELDRSQDIETAVLSCDSELTWQHGNSLINYMKLVSSRVRDEFVNQVSCGSEIYILVCGVRST